MGKIAVTERVTGHTELIGLIAYPIRAAAFKLWRGKEMPVDFIKDVLF